MGALNTVLINVVVGNAFAPQPAPPPPPLPVPQMVVPVRDVYNAVCFALLEDYELRLGILTDSQFIDYLEEAILEFAQQVGLIKKIYTQQTRSAQPQYIIPDDILQVQCGFINAMWIEHVSLDELQNGEFDWAKQYGTPTAYFEDGMPTSRAQLFPIPDYTGTEIQTPQPPFGHYGTFDPGDGNFTVVGSSGPTMPIALTLDDNIPAEIPASFTPYLIYRILWRVASLDGEAKDSQRAAYCLARWNEGISLAQAIMMEAVFSDNAK